jgi:hypothetical protein
MRKYVVKKLPSRKQMLANGGEIQGPSHEMGGVAVQDPSGEQVAEVEGGERVFSTEDTAMLEQSAMQIAQLQEQNPQAADQLATELGYAVVEMIMRQEQMAQGDAAMQGAQPSPEQMANQFG